jgi:hypothetical protein
VNLEPSKRNNFLYCVLVRKFEVFTILSILGERLTAPEFDQEVAFLAAFLAVIEFPAKSVQRRAKMIN